MHYRINTNSDLLSFRHECLSVIIFLQKSGLRLLSYAVAFAYIFACGVRILSLLAHFLLCCAFYCTFRYSPMTCSTFLFEDSLHDVTRFSIQFSKVTTKEAKKPIGAERMTGRHVRQVFQPIKSLFLCHMCVILFQYFLKTTCPDCSIIIVAAVWCQQSQLVLATSKKCFQRGIYRIHIFQVCWCAREKLEKQIYIIIMMWIYGHGEQEGICLSVCSCAASCM